MVDALDDGSNSFDLLVIGDLEGLNIMNDVCVLLLVKEVPVFGTGNVSDDFVIKEC